MPAITSLDLSNAKLDVDHIAAIATSLQPTATDRLGNTKDTMSGAVYSIKSFNDKGSWIALTTYELKDLVSVDVSSVITWYVCVVPHTSSGSFSTDSASKWRIYQGITTGDLSSVTGSSLVGYQRNSSNSLATNVETILKRSWPTQLEYSNLQEAVNANYGSVLRLVKNPDNSPILLPVGGLKILHPIRIVADIGNEDTNYGTVVRKTANTVGIEVLSPYVELENIWLQCSKAGFLGFEDTTDGIVWGRNDGAGGTNVANGYVNALRGRLKNVTITKAGRDGLSYQEGYGLVTDDVAVLESARDNYYISPTAYDASHGDWHVISAGAGRDGFSFQFGSHIFRLVKSFADTGRGVLLNNARGCVGNIFVELSGGPFIEFGTDTLANKIFVQFWTTGKSYIDNGIGNMLEGMSLGSNNGAVVSTSTRTNNLYVRNEFKAGNDSSAYPQGAFKLRHDADYLTTIGDSVNQSHVRMDAGGGSLQNFAAWRSSFNLVGLGNQNLNTGNEYVHFWEIGDGQTLSLGIPKNGREACVINTTGSNAFVSGQIGGGSNTITLVPGACLDLKYFSNATTWRIINKYTP